MKILHTADWHLDLANLDYTVPAVEALIAKAHELKPDLIVHAGDIAVHRGSIHPHVARLLRVLLTRLAAEAPLGMLLVEGNHDQVYTAGRDGAALGILAGEDDDQSACGRIRIVTTPQVVEYSDGDTADLAFVCIPSPNRYWLDAAKANGAEDADVAGLLGSIVRGLIAQAGPGCRSNRIGVFHGSIAGGRAGDEWAMKAGMDGVLPVSAWQGCGAVLCGHLHHAQRLGKDKFLYPGSIAPLTWQDANLRPRAYLIDTVADAVEAVWLPVVSQMLQADVDIVAGDGAVPLHEQLVAVARSTWGAVDGARLRLHVRAPGAVLDGLSVPAEEVLLAATLGARDVTLVTERTDEGRVRFDMDASWGPLQAFARWLDLQGITEDAERTALIAMADGVERQVEDAHLDARYEMQPVCLVVSNWCQYAEAVVDFEALGKVVAVTGANYAGKSNLMRAILFALYKHQVSGNLLSDLIRKGQDKAAVGLTYRSGDATYRIVRELRRGSDGRKCTATLAFLRLDDSAQWCPVNEGKANETQAAIERLVGPLDLFLATSFAGQNAVDGLLDLTPAEMKDLLLGVLQRDFAARVEILRAKMRMHDDQAKTIRTKHDVYEAQGRAADELLDRLARYAELIRDDESAIAAAENPDTYLDEIAQARAELLRLEAAAAKRGELQVQLKAAQEEAAAAVTALTAKRAGLVGKLATARADLAEASKSVEAALLAGKRAAVIDVELAELPAPNPDLAERLIASRATYDATIATASEQEAAARAASEAATKREGDARTVAAAAANALRAAIDAHVRARHAADLLDKVTCEGDTWVAQGSGGLVDMSICPLLKDAVAAREALPGLVEAEATCLIASGGADAAHAEAQTFAATAAAHVVRVATEASQAISAARVTVAALQDQADAQGKLERKWAELQAELAQNQARAGLLEAAERSHGAAVGTVERIECDLAALPIEDAPNETVTRLEAELASATNGEQVAEARGRILRAEAARHNAVELRDRLREDLDAHRREQAILTEKHEAAKTAATEAGRLLAAIAVEEQARARAATVESAMQRDGIPFMLLEQFAIPHLRGLVNRYLAETDIRVAVQTERELLGGDMRDAVELTFTDHRGEHPLSAASGFQRTAIGMALRNALADLHAAATGSRLWLSVQDEGLGPCDEAHLDGVKTTIRTIADHRGGHFIIASHVGGVADIADSVLAVSEVDGHSVVEVR